MTYKPKDRNVVLPFMENSSLKCSNLRNTSNLLEKIRKTEGMKSTLIIMHTKINSIMSGKIPAILKNLPSSISKNSDVVATATI